MKDVGRQEAGLQQVGRLLQRLQEFAHREAVVAARLIGIGRAPGGNGRDPFLASQSIAPRTIGPAIDQHVIQPLLHQRRNRIPVERVLEDETIMGQQGLLLGRDVDLALRIKGVNVAHRDVRLRRQALCPGTIDPGAVQVRMKEIDQYLHGGLRSGNMRPS